MWWYLIPGTWYREPFCHQMGPYQTLRAGNWWTQLLVSFRVFFIFNKSRNHLNRFENPGTLLFPGKRPLPGSLHTVVRIVVKIPSFQKSSLDHMTYQDLKPHVSWHLLQTQNQCNWCVFIGVGIRDVIHVIVIVCCRGEYLPEPVEPWPIEPWPVNQNDLAGSRATPSACVDELSWSLCTRQALWTRHG